MRIGQITDHYADTLRCCELNWRFIHRKVSGDVRLVRKDLMHEDWSVVDGQEVEHVLELGE